MNSNKSKICCNKGFTLIEQVTVKQGCHPEFISGSTPLVAIQNKEEMLGPRIKTLRGSASGNAAVQHDNRRRGFTLLELLVVVLIIGILAAVAVPQYQKAVKRSKFFTAVPLVNKVAEAEEVFWLANGNYTDNLSELDIEIGSVPTDGTLAVFLHSGKNIGGIEFCVGLRKCYRKILKHTSFPPWGIVKGKGYCIDDHVALKKTYCSSFLSTPCASTPLCDGWYGVWYPID